MVPFVPVCNLPAVSLAMPMRAALENVRCITAWSRRKGANAADSHRIESVGIIGAGLMGTSIAAAHIRYDCPVYICDADAGVLANTKSEIARHLSESDLLSEQKAVDRMVTTTAELSDLAKCDLLIEAIAERLGAKSQLFATLQPMLGPHIIVASNTSTIPMQRLSQNMAYPDRFCGLHFCHPVLKRPLVEIVRGQQTSDATIAGLVSHVLRIDRIPIVVKDGPGFIVNRLLFPYLTAGLELLREGVPMATIEQAATDFGMAMGPLQLMDEIGLDTTLHAAWVLATAFPERVVSSPLLVSLVKAGRLGQKTGAGFFAYDAPNGRVVSRDMDAAVTRLFAPWIETSPQPKTPVTGERLVLPMLTEASRILAEGMAEDPRDIDLAVLYGLGFPAEKGGLLWWADSLGASTTLALLEPFAHLGPHLASTAMLRCMAANRQTFYGRCS